MHTQTIVNELHSRVEIDFNRGRGGIFNTLLAAIQCPLYHFHARFMFDFLKKHSEASKPSPVKPPVDLNQPVENPRLAAAILAFTKSRTLATQNELTHALRTAKFLVPILTDEMHSTPSGIDGQMTIQAGSRIKIVTCFDDVGGNHLALFTDWPSIRRWTEQPVSTLVMPAAEAFEFASSDQHAGAVVNPGDNALPLDKRLLAYLLDQSKPTDAPTL